MNRIKMGCFIVLFAGITTTGFSQYFRLGKVSEVQEVKKRQVLVQLEEEDPKMVKKLSKKPEELAAYRAELKRVNEALPRLVAKLWSFNALPVTKTESEIDALRKAKNKDYAFVALNRIEVTEWMDNGVYGRYKYSSKVIATFFVDLVENTKWGTPVYYQNLPNPFPTEGDIALGIEMMQNFLQARLDGKKRNEISDEASENKALLTGKTLLIDREDLKEGFGEAQVKAAYAYPFSIVDYSTIEAAIINRDNRYAVVQIIPLMVGVEANAHIVMSTENGKCLRYYAPIQTTTTFGKKNSEARIGERHLKAYVK